MLFYLTGMRMTAAMLVWIVLAGCGRGAGMGGLGSMEDEHEPAVDRKAASSPAAVISVLGVRG